MQSSELETNKIRKDFPILTRKINGKPFVYLDNASTTQKPLSVINKIVDYYSLYNSNIHRAVYDIAEEATNAYELTRKKVCKFINANSPQEIIFTRNATEAIKNQQPPVSRINLFDLQEASVDWDKLENGIHGEAARTPESTQHLQLTNQPLLQPLSIQVHLSYTPRPT